MSFTRYPRRHSEKCLRKGRRWMAMDVEGVEEEEEEEEGDDDVG